MFDELFVQTQKKMGPWARLWTDAVRPEAVDRARADAQAAAAHATDLTRQAIDRWSEVSRASVDWSADVGATMSEATLEVTRAIFATMRNVGQTLYPQAAAAAVPDPSGPDEA